MPVKNVNSDDIARLVRDATQNGRRRIVLTGHSGAGGSSGGGNGPSSDGPGNSRGFVNPMDGYGDIIYGGVAGAGRRLPSGIAGKVLLLINDGTGIRPAWGDANPLLVIQVGDSTVVSSTQTIDFDDDFFGATQSPTGEANVTLKALNVVTQEPVWIPDELVWDENGDLVTADADAEVSWG